MRKILPVIALWLLSGCATYHISVESLQEQMGRAHKQDKENLLIPVYNIEGNSIRTLRVLDKNEHEYRLGVNKHTGIRIRKKDGKKVSFYFDTLLVTDSTITGSKTHLFNAKIKPIPFSEVSKMELQQ